MYSHSRRPRPGRRRHQLAFYPAPMVFLLLLTIMLLTPTLARELEIPYKEYNSPLFRRLARRGEITIDRRDPPPRPVIRQRQENDSPLDSTTAAPLATSTSESLATASASSTDSDPTTAFPSTLVLTPTSTVAESGVTTSPGNATMSIETASSSASASSPLPSSFDTSLGSNFTSQACPDFFNSFLSNATFRDCHPVSLLLQNSNSFFKTSRSPVLLSQALDAACGAPLAQCSPLMASLASRLVQDSNCGPDYRKENPVVTQAHSGLIAYEPLYRASCLKNSATGNYCFVDAITNTSSPADSYPYYTALGTNLPAASRPTCDKCLSDTMDIFAGYAAMKTQPVSTTYMSTAQQINLGCGPDFVNATVPVATVANSAVKQSAISDASALMAFVVGLVLACMAF